jgi:hypothetical protein
MNESLTSKLNCLINILKDENYFKRENIANEVPFYIFDYNPEDELEVRKTINQISESKQIKYNVEILNLYDIAINYLQDNNLLEKTFEIEKKFTPEKFFTRLKSIIDPELILNKIVEISVTKEPDILILTGIGNIYPILRAHLIINKLQEKIYNKTVILMYPGTFEISDTEGQLLLFNKLESKAFYRAFKICGGGVR